jgi:hypothetical protein
VWGPIQKKGWEGPQENQAYLQLMSTRLVPHGGLSFLICKMKEIDNNLSGPFSCCAGGQGQPEVSWEKQTPQSLRGALYKTRDRIRN